MYLKRCIHFPMGMNEKKKKGLARYKAQEEPQRNESVFFKKNKLKNRNS